MAKEVNDKVSEETVKNTQMRDLNFNRALAYVNSAKLILRDLEKNNMLSATLKKYKKEDVIKWLETPSKYVKELREASIYLSNASNYYKRLIEYFADMNLFAHVVIPSKLPHDTSKINIDKFSKAYQKATDLVDTMNLRHEFGKIMTTVFTEDVFYGYEYTTKDSYFIRKMPSEYCEITSIEDGVFVYSFNFDYFSSSGVDPETWGSDFAKNYKAYKNKTNTKWQELPSDKTICIKLNEHLDYAIPPFIAVLGALFDLEDYKALKKTGEELGNYKLLTLRIPLNDDGSFKIDATEAAKYYEMMGENLPENIGLALTPMEIGEHKFEQATQSATNKVAEAEQAYWSATGTSAHLFSSEKSTASVVNNSIKTDEEFIFSLNRQFERWLNYKLKRLSGTYKFKVNILDATVFNKKEFLDQLQVQGTYGMPVILAMASVLGYSINDFTGLLFLENSVLELHNKMIPLSSTHTMNTGEIANNEGGRPLIDEDELEETGEQARDVGNDRDKLVE